MGRNKQMARQVRLVGQAGKRVKKEVTNKVPERGCKTSYYEFARRIK